MIGVLYVYNVNTYPFASFLREWCGESRPGFLRLGDLGRENLVSEHGRSSFGPRLEEGGLSTLSNLKGTWRGVPDQLTHP